MEHTDPFGSKDSTNKGDPDINFRDKSNEAQISATCDKDFNFCDSKDSRNSPCRHNDRSRDRDGDYGRHRNTDRDHDREHGISIHRGLNRNCDLDLNCDDDSDHDEDEAINVHR